MPYTPYTYRCGVCQTVSTHPSREDADEERRGHAERVHDGRTPESEAITNTDLRPRRVPASPLERKLDTVAFLVLAACIVASLLYTVTAHLFG